MKAKQRGWEDFYSCQNDNPYPAGSAQHRYWREGWKQAQRHAYPVTQYHLRNRKKANG